MEKRNIGSKRMKVVPFTQPRLHCIWMSAGVVNFKLCDRAFDCTSCPFDRAMRAGSQKESGKMVSWRDTMRRRSYRERYCRHMLTGVVEYRLCGNDYNCDHCSFDQELDMRTLTSVAGNPVEVRLNGVRLAEGYYYHAGHTWVRVESGGLVRVGVDDFASKMLGPADHVRLPRLGETVHQAEPGWLLERSGREAPVRAPLDGTVMALNGRIKSDPALCAHDPYGDGWLFVILPEEMKKNADHLMGTESAREWLGGEIQKLQNLVMAEYPYPMAATGGELIDDVYGSVPGLDWDDLVETFL